MLQSERSSGKCTKVCSEKQFRAARAFMTTRTRGDHLRPDARVADMQVVVSALMTEYDAWSSRLTYDLGRTLRVRTSNGWRQELNESTRL